MPGQARSANTSVTENIDGVAMSANVALAICTFRCRRVAGRCGVRVISQWLALRPIRRRRLFNRTNLVAGISVTPDSMPTDDELILGTGVMQLIYSPLAAGQRQVLITGQCRSNSTDPVDLYLVAQIGLGNCTAKGYVSARRVR